MNIYLASDHRGFQLKEQLKQAFPDLIDVGAFSYDPDDDEVDYAIKAIDPATWLSSNRAILLCGSGHGMDMTANRFSHIRAILGFNHEVVKMGREHQDANVLIIPSDWTTSDQAIKLISVFLSTQFTGAEKYVRRLQKLQSLNTNH